MVLTEFPPSFGGMQTHALELSRWLHARGYVLEVATYRLEDGPAEVPDLPFRVHRVLSRVSYHANLRKLERVARAMGAELIYSSTVYFGELATRLGIPMFCRSAGNDVLRPWIAWPFEAGSTVLDLPWVERQLYRRWKKWEWPERLESLLLGRRADVMRASARRMARIFANSEYTRKLLYEAEVDRERVSLLPGGVDANFFARSPAARAELGLERDGYYLLTACRLVEKKGLDTLLASMAILRAKGARLQLLIAGEGKQRRHAENLIAALDLTSTVQLLGYVRHDRLRDYMHAANAFVLSSKDVVHPRTGLRDSETMGRVLCEAGASGLPVIASASGGIPSIVENGVNGLLVESGSAGDLAEKIELLWRDPILSAKLGRCGKERAQTQFDWPVLFAAHEQAIQSLLVNRI